MEPASKEIIFIDGNSEDGTAEYLKHVASKSTLIKYLNNPERIVPYALNKGIAEAKGDVIIRIDAHTEYAMDYFTTILETFSEVEADIVGGPYRTAAKSVFQAAVGYAISSPLGIGNSKVHQADFCGYTDSVAYGAWRKELFKDTGYFDERLKRNQDDEFHYRARSLGKKIYQNPAIKLYYYPRNNLKALFKQYFQYGLYKPLVLKKIKSETKVRHLIPSFFTLYLFSLCFIVPFFPLYLLPLVLYVGLILRDIYQSSGDKKGSFWSLLLIYPTLHLAYGSGFIIGLTKIK
jgi:GT2 family glycosyltransferase